MGYFFAFAVGANVTLSVALIINADDRRNMWIEALVRGYAEYCPKTDSFAWKGECQ